MNRDLSISCIVSLMLHAALFAALALWTTTRIARDLSGTAPKLSVHVVAHAPPGPSPQPAPRPAAAADDTWEAATSAVARGPTTAKVAAAPPPTAAPSADRAARPVSVEPPIAGDAAKSPPLPLPPASSPTPRPARVATNTDATHPTRAIVVAHVAEDAPTHSLAHSRATAAAPVTMSATQTKMLGKQLKKWSSNLHRMNLRDATTTWRHKDQEYVAAFETQSADDTGIDEVIVKISTVEDGATVSTDVRLRRLAFSSFAQFVNRWDPNVQIHDDELTGRFHSNSQITLGYTRSVAPTFHGKVTTASRAVNILRTSGVVGRDEMFLGGLETGVRRIRLPKRFDALTGRRADRDTHVFDGDTRLVFVADGTCLAGPADRSRPARSIGVHGTTANFSAQPKSKLFVSGTVRGNLLVYSPEDIVIEGDLVYAHDPLTEPNSDNFLGLVTDRSVIIAHPDVTGPGDLHVHASIYAKRRFAVKRFRQRENAVLHIFGSVSAGSVTATEPRYATRIVFDPRLETRRAPGFPLTDRYETVAWDKTWRRQ